MNASYTIWGMNVPASVLNPKDLKYLKNLPPTLPKVEWVWHEMDRVWNELGLDNKKPLFDQPVSEYYSHPVWLMNGFFTALDPLSVQHRESIAMYISQLNPSHVADYGGGFGELALQIAKRCLTTKVFLIEPYPSKLGLARIKEEPRISFVSTLDTDYDVVIAQDVLEHIEDPIGLAYKLATSLKLGGIAIFANNFYPVIKCHLPVTFFLRYSFPHIMKIMGMDFIGSVDGAPHALIFERRSLLNLQLVRLAESYFRLEFPIMNILRRLVSKLR